MGIKNEKGFTVESLLILVIVLMLAGTGLYVYRAHNNANNTYTSADAINNSTVDVKKDPTADWVAHADKTGQFTLKYPKSWSTVTDQSSCGDGVLLLGADSKSVGACGSSYLGQISIFSMPGDYQKDNELTTATTGSGNLGFKNITTVTVTVDKVKGEKQTGTSTGANIEGPPTLPDGTNVTKYIFYANKRTYILTYASGDYSGKAYVDVLSDFDLMVTKTLKFSAS